jgi:hypothetical protein
MSSQGPDTLYGLLQVVQSAPLPSDDDERRGAIALAATLMADLLQREPDPTELRNVRGFILELRIIVLYQLTLRRGWILAHITPEEGDAQLPELNSTIHAALGRTVDAAEEMGDAWDQAMHQEYRMAVREMIEIFGRTDEFVSMALWVLDVPE